MTTSGDLLTQLVERITAQLTPALNTGSAMDALILVAAAVRGLRDAPDAIVTTGRDQVSCACVRCGVVEIPPPLQ